MDGSSPDDPVVVTLDEATMRRLRTHASATGTTAEALVTAWVRQRLEVEDATRRARGGGAEQLLRLVQAIEDLEVPDP